ncbi:helix-turn-helix domain-containing protein [Myxococcus xanthus]|uniref:helix-turn-helix domain-containing protein n=1 Tax=Myxococcus xanthus TaxID=34 RepID=UPI00112E5177
MAWQARRLSAEQQQERGLEAARLLRHGFPQVRVARELGVSEAAVSKWAARLRSGGLRALRARRHPGRPSRFAPVSVHAWSPGISRVLPARLLPAAQSRGAVPIADTRSRPHV